MISISKRWRESMWPKLLHELERVAFGKMSEIKEVYFLYSTLLNDKNLEKLGSWLAQRDLRRLTKYRPNVPLDSDERDYDLILLVYITTETKKFLGLCKEIDYKQLELIQLIEIETLDLETFRAKQQVYPS